MAILAILPWNGNKIIKASMKSELNSFPLWVVSSSLILLLLLTKIITRANLQFSIKPRIFMEKTCIWLHLLLPDPISHQWFSFGAVAITMALLQTLFSREKNLWLDVVPHFWVRTLHLAFAWYCKHCMQPYESFFQVCQHSFFPVYFIDILLKLPHLKVTNTKTENTDFSSSQAIL